MAEAEFHVKVLDDHSAGITETACGLELDICTSVAMPPVTFGQAYDIGRLSLCPRCVEGLLTHRAAKAEAEAGA